VDSAGTLDYHRGSPPDERAQSHALGRGYDLSDLRARPVTAHDFATFDLILVMDWDNLDAVNARRPSRAKAEVRRLTEYCRNHVAQVVPDPYYGGDKGFEAVLDLVEDACDGLLAYVREQLDSPPA
jgi:protein-tyrosine phosphatase